MSIKIKKDGQVREFILPATNIQVLDIADKFKKKDLENVIKEISDTEHIYIGEVDETKDGIWIDDGEILDNAEDNGVVERIKEYVDGQIKDYSNPNLLVNGDFQVWNNGESFVVSNKYIDIADKWVVNDGTINKTTLNGKSAIKITKSANDKEINLQQYVENIHSFKGNTLTLSWKSHTDTDTDITLLMFSYKSDNSVETFYTGVEKYTSGLIEKHKVTFKIPDTIDNTCETLCIRILRRSSATSEHNIIVSNVKLEIGEQVTPFVPKKYSEELLACNDGIIGSNPNLLINGDFQVWQRGTSFNGNTSRPVYTADRWIIAGDTAPKVEKVENGVKITSTQNGTWTNFYTKLENVTLRKLIGKTLTYTIKLKVPTRISQVWAVTVSTGGGEYHHSKVFNDKNYEYLTGSFVVKSTQFDDNGFFELGIQGIPEANNSFEIEYAKLELGSVATPFVPRHYAEELALCQRYYFRNRWLSLRTAVCTENELRTSSYYFPVPMRVSPTINTVIGQPVHEFYTPNLTYHVGQPSLGTIAPKPMVIYNNVMCDFQFATNNVPKNDYTIEIKDNVYEFDAEIY